MKKFFLATLMVAMLIACKNEQTEQTENKQETMQATEEEKTIDVSKLTFASDKDPICGMPVKSGVADTATVDGKLYGFCAKECKEEFLKQQQAKK